jgi:hypothetical protein
MASHALFRFRGGARLSEPNVANVVRRCFERAIARLWIESGWRFLICEDGGDVCAHAWQTGRWLSEFRCIDAVRATFVNAVRGSTNATSSAEKK